MCDVFCKMLKLMCILKRGTLSKVVNLAIFARASFLSTFLYFFKPPAMLENLQLSVEL